MTEFTITDGHMSHTVKTKEEAQRIIDRYFGKVERNNMKEFLEKRIKDEYLRILERKVKGWGAKELNAYIAGTSNTLDNLINDFQANGLLQDTEANELDDLLEIIAHLSETIDEL